MWEIKAVLNQVELGTASFDLLTPRAMSQPVPATCSGVTPLLLANTPLAFDAGCSPELGAPGLLPGPTSTSTSPGMTESGTTRSSTAHNSPLSDAEIALTSGDTCNIIVIQDVILLLEIFLPAVAGLHVAIFSGQTSSKLKPVNLVNPLDQWIQQSTGPVNPTIHWTSESNNPQEIIVTILIEVLTLCNSIILLNIFFLQNLKIHPLWIVRRRYLRSGPCFNSAATNWLPKDVHYILLFSPFM